MDTGRSRVNLPRGFRFAPKDDELVRHYLFNKVTRKSLSSYLSIIECDVYGKEEAWRKIFDTIPEEEHTLYFFSKLKKKTAKGTRNDRLAGTAGTWKEQSDKKIIHNKTMHVGSLRKFSYTKTGTRVAIEGWVMHEYRLGEDLINQIIDGGVYLRNFQDYVVCKIIRKEGEKPSVTTLMGQPQGFGTKIAFSPIAAALQQQPQSFYSFTNPFSLPPTITKENNHNLAFSNQNLSSNPYQIGRGNQSKSSLNSSESVTFPTSVSINDPRTMPSKEVVPTSAATLILKEEEEEVLPVGTDNMIGEGGTLHKANNVEEMAQIREMAELHDIEWNDAVNNATSVWWHNTLESMDARSDAINNAASEWWFNTFGSMGTSLPPDQWVY